MKFKLLLLLLTLVSLTVACSGKDNSDNSDITYQKIEEKLTGDVVVDKNEPEVIPEPDPEPIIETAPTNTLAEGEVYSLLTGLPIDEAISNQRPVSVMINNLPKALPQSGIAQADIYYETLVESGITRLLAIYQNFDAKKIGPVRSSRHYYLDFSLDNDAVYVHHGGSELAYGSISSLKISNIDGMKAGDTFWRDAGRVNLPGMYEHSSYTGAEQIKKAVERYKYRNAISDKQPMFKFLQADEVLPNGQQANNVTVPFSNEQISVFKYDADEKVYYRSQNSKPHIDELTGEQLSVTNIIIQYATIYVIKNDTAGRRNIELIGSGDGLLITNGQSFPINWSKSDHYTPTKWTASDGTEIKLSPGKTWICVFPKEKDVQFE